MTLKGEFFNVITFCLNIADSSYPHLVEVNAVHGDIALIDPLLSGHVACCNSSLRCSNRPNGIIYPFPGDNMTRAAYISCGIDILNRGTLAIINRDYPINLDICAFKKVCVCFNANRRNNKISFFFSAVLIGYNIRIPPVSAWQ